MKAIKKKSVSFILIFAIMLSVMLSALGPSFMATTPFVDVPAGQWYSDNITIAYDDGVMTGTYYNSATGEREFSPFSPLTMAEWTVMLVRAWYADELANSSVGYMTWFNKEAAVLQSHGIYGVLGTNNTISFYESASRNQMAVTIANLLKDKGVGVSASDIAAAKQKIPDLSSIPANYQDAVAACYHLGVLTGKEGGRFCGNDSMQRCEAATVYVRVKNVLKSGSTSTDPGPNPSTPVDPTPSNPVGGSPVGTISSTKVKLNKDSINTHAPITDYWAQQPMEIRNISDRNSFNAACQTLKDSSMILNQGQVNNLGVNQYYNYAVAPYSKEKTAVNVDLAMANLSGCGGTYDASGSSFRIYLLAPLRTTTTSAPRFAATIASFTPDMSDRAKAEACVRAVCDQLSYEIAGNASWDNGGDKGDCTSYARMAVQILSAAGIPNIHMAGTVQGGGHAWVQVYLPDEGQWYVLDGTATESGYGTLFTAAEHGRMYGYDSAMNDTDSCRVAKALVELFF